MSDNNGNGFGSGFFLGALLGGAAVFLLGTKKGKKLLKSITEEGIESVSDLEEFFASVDEEEIRKPSKNSHQETVVEKVTTSGLTKVASLAETAAKAAESAASAAIHVAKATEDFEKKSKRFFRGIPKRRAD